MTGPRLVKTVAEPWESGPPPGRFDDVANDAAPASVAVETPAQSLWETRISGIDPEWLSKAPPPRTWLLRDARQPKAHGVLPLGKVGEIVAEGGAGKTMAIMQLGIAVGTGGTWFGALSVPKAGRVFLGLGEEDTEEARRRIYNGARVSGADPKAIAQNIVVMPLLGIPCAMIESVDRVPVESEFLVGLRAWLKANGPWTLIVLDPLSRFAGLAAETDNAMGTRFIQALESIATETSATVLVSHHTNKVSRGAGADVDTSSSRGSTAITDGARWVCTMSSAAMKMADPETQERLGEIVTVKFTKSNYSRKAEPIVLRRDIDNGGALLPLDDLDHELVASARESTRPAAIKSAARESEADAKRAREAEAKAEKEAAKARKEADEMRAEDDALRACVRMQPGINETDILVNLRARLGKCSDATARTAIARAKTAGWLQVETGAKNAKKHHVVEVPK